MKTQALAQDSERRYLLTGCASGIGRRLAEDLIARGARVLATDLDIEALEAVARKAGWPGERVLLRRLDVRDPVDWDAALGLLQERWDGLDVLLNIAGFLRPGQVAEADDEAVHLQIDVNLKGVVFGMRAAARQMKKQGSGHIVNIASMAALAPIPGLALYSASKYAVRAVSLAAAEELRPYGVAVTAVCPDAVQTPMLDLQVDYDDAALTFSAPRFLTVEDISRVVLGKVLRKRPLLVAIPQHRAWLARFADLFPGMSRRIAPLLRRQGRARQEAARRKKSEITLD